MLDGVDLGPFLRGAAGSPRDTMWLYRGDELFAVRHGPFKAHFKARPGYGARSAQEHDPPLLYHLEHDSAEQLDVAADHPEVLGEIRALAEAHKADVTPAPSRLDER